MLSNWSGWHTVGLVITAVNAACLAVHNLAGMPDFVVTATTVEGQIGNVLLMLVTAISGSALAKAVSK